MGVNLRDEKPNYNLPKKRLVAQCGTCVHRWLVMISHDGYILYELRGKLLDFVFKKQKNK